MGHLDETRLPGIGKRVEFFTDEGRRMGGSPAIGRSIGDLRLRTRTGASVVAVIRRPQPVPAPEPDFVVGGGGPQPR